VTFLHFILSKFDIEMKFNFIRSGSGQVLRSGKLVYTFITTPRKLLHMVNNYI